MERGMRRAVSFGCNPKPFQTRSRKGCHDNVLLALSLLLVGPSCGVQGLACVLSELRNNELCTAPRRQLLVKHP